MADRDLDGTNCRSHGERRKALLCRHLAGDDRRPYYATPACEHGPAMAWCAECDELVEKDRGWSDAAERHADFFLYSSSVTRTPSIGTSLWPMFKGLMIRVSGMVYLGRLSRETTRPFGDRDEGCRRRLTTG